MNQDTDVRVENHGSIFLFRTSNEAVHDWFTEHTPDCLFLGAYAVEPRYAVGIASALVEAGFSVA